MANPMKYYETQNDNIYVLNGSRQALAFVPKNLSKDVRVFMIFKDGNLESLQEQERNKMFFETQEISKRINSSDSNGIFITAFIDDKVLVNRDNSSYSNELNNIKNLVNNIYNKVLGEGNIRKENFVKRLELVSSDSRYNSFINWLCLQNPAKFHSVSYQSLINDNTEKQNSVFINNNEANIFVEPTKQSTMMGMQSNITPINESLSIGSPRNIEFMPKTLVRTMPNNRNNAAFIKWHTILFILLISLTIGVAISIVLVK